MASRGVLSVVGARPQFIKAGPVSRALARAGVEEIVIHTGQHYDPSLSQIFFDELGLRPPDVNLGVGSGTHGEQTAQMLVGLERCLRDYRPAWTILYGDTNSTLAAAIAASKLGLPIAHVEAGLRSFNRRNPEEINRIVVDALSDRLFTPTDGATAHLRREGVAASRIFQSGDVMYDAFLFHQGQAAASTILDALALEPKEYLLATIHRAENTDDPKRLTSIARAIWNLAARRAVVWPVHPRTRRALEALDLPSAPAKLRMIEPVGYLDMGRLTGAACVVLTDSGGLQKEAFFHRVPCVTARDETEWVELVELGWNRLAPPVSFSALEDAVTSAPGSTGDAAARPYGNGRAAEAIVASLESL